MHDQPQPTSQEPVLPCAYCSKPIVEKVTRGIRRVRRVCGRQRIFTDTEYFCSKQCASFQQMAAEG